METLLAKATVRMQITLGVVKIGENTVHLPWSTLLQCL